MRYSDSPADILGEDGTRQPIVGIIRLLDNQYRGVPGTKATSFSTQCLLRDRLDVIMVMNINPIRSV